MRSLDESFVRAQLPRRSANGHKGDYGLVHILAGSTPYRGAAVLNVSGALRAGAGLVQLFSIERVCAAVAVQHPCCLLHPLPEKDGSVAFDGDAALIESKAGAIAIGSGMENTADTASWVAFALENTPCPLVLDADALNAVAADKRLKEAIKGTAQPVLLTPHIGEMARLTGMDAADISSTQVETACRFAAEHKCIVVLKSHKTVVAAPPDESGIQECFINESAGNPGMAKGGSGDVLCGVIAGLLAQGLKPEKAAATGVWLHARAGDKSAEQFGQMAMLPSDLPDMLAEVFREIGR